MLTFCLAYRVTLVSVSRSHHHVSFCEECLAEVCGLNPGGGTRDVLVVTPGVFGENLVCVYLVTLEDHDAYVETPGVCEGNPDV